MSKVAGLEGLLLTFVVHLRNPLDKKQTLIPLLYDDTYFPYCQNSKLFSTDSL